MLLTEMRTYILVMKNKIPLHDYLTFVSGVLVMTASLVGVICLTYFANC